MVALRLTPALFLRGALGVLVNEARTGRGVLQHQQLEHLATERKVTNATHVAAGSGSANQPEVVDDDTKLLRICNAYTHSQGVHVKLERTLEDVGKLPYKGCGDFRLPIFEADRLNFTLDGEEKPMGTFAVSGLPANVKTLLLIVSRRPNSVGASFVSHAFGRAASEEEAQIAVIDTYLGASRTFQVIIRDLNLAGSSQEYIPLNSVVAIAAGEYSVQLPSDSDPLPKEDGLATLVANAGQSYVVLRVGQLGATSDVDSVEAYGEQLVIFPQESRSSCVRGGRPLLAIWAIIAGVAVWAARP